MSRMTWKWYIHPILIFVFSITAVAVSFFLYIYWYVEVSSGLKGIIEKANIDAEKILAPHTWVVILVLSLLVAIILMGLFIIFVYNQKTIQLYRLQRNFINTFTHELKTPVTSLKLYLETFQKYNLSREDQLKYIEYMIHDADRLSGTISRMLNLAQLESKTFKGKFATRDLVNVTARFLERSRHIFEGAQIELHNPSGRPFEYRIDLSLFEMLLMNLLTNAIKYNESDAPRVDITFRPGFRRLRILFEDNGIGIQTPEIKKIFRKFYQIGRSDDMSAKGSGLGLYLVDSIIRIHKGRITAASKGVGRGSTFTLLLPLGLSLSKSELADEPH